MAVARTYAFSLTGVGEAEQVNGNFVTSDFFSQLGVNPVIGRSFSTGEDEVGAGAVALLGARTVATEVQWCARRFGEEHYSRLEVYTIVGVIPANFRLSVPGFRQTATYMCRLGNGAILCC